jgi:hypothetical protein
MSHDSTTTGNGPWQLLILDRDPADPKWLVVTVNPGGVRPVTTVEAVIPDLDEVTQAWAATAAGLHRPALTRLRHADVWRIDEQPQEN